MSRGPWRTARFCVHACLEVLPSHRGCLDLGGGQPPCRLAEGIEQDKQPIRSPIEHAVVLCSEVAAKLSQLAVHLGAMRERKMRDLVAEQVETGDLVEQRNTALLLERLEKLANRLASVSGAVVDRLEGRHATTHP